MSAAGNVAALIERVHYDNAFQHACQRYVHQGGSSMAIARAALNASGLCGSGAIVLPAPGSAPWTYRESSNTTRLECFVGEDHAEVFVKLGVNDNGWAVELWHPAYWYQHLVRTDDQGRRWRAEGAPHVMDDFGFLVPVGGAA